MIIRKRFDEIPDYRRDGSVRSSLSDTMMTALAAFQFKSTSLLQFEKGTRNMQDLTLVGNLKRLYCICEVPCDIQMHTILDEESPGLLRRAFRGVHSTIRRGRMLEDFKVFGDKLVVSIEDTGLFSPTSIHCPKCGVKKRKSRKDEYYHQLLVAVIVSSHNKTVLPMYFKAIIRSDGEIKDCCERNATKRLIPSIACRCAMRHLIIVEDALAANGPHVKLPHEHEIDFVIGAEPAGSLFLFAAFDERQRQTQGDIVEFEQTDTKGVKREWSWITSLLITPDNALEIAANGRSTWMVGATQ